MPLTDRQLEVLANRLNSSRVATRQQSGKTLSYLEAWDVKAHLIRVFGYGGFDSELIEYHHVTDRPYMNGDKEMVEVIYSARIRLTIHDTPTDDGYYPDLCVYTEGACGSASGPMSMLGEHHDNALKQAESDALKRCAINLGNQFGLSLYDQGSKGDVVKGTLLDPPKPEEELTPQQTAALQNSLGATEVTQEEGATA